MGTDLSEHAAGAGWAAGGVGAAEGASDGTVCGRGGYVSGGGAHGGLVQRERVGDAQRAALGRPDGARASIWLFALHSPAPTANPAPAPAPISLPHSDVAVCLVAGGRPPSLPLARPWPVSRSLAAPPRGAAPGQQRSAGGRVAGACCSPHRDALPEAVTVPASLSCTSLVHPRLCRALSSSGRPHHPPTTLPRHSTQTACRPEHMPLCLSLALPLPIQICRKCPLSFPAQVGLSL